MGDAQVVGLRVGLGRQPVEDRLGGGVGEPQGRPSGGRTPGSRTRPLGGPRQRTHDRVTRGRSTELPGFTHGRDGKRQRCRSASVPAARYRPRRRSHVLGQRDGTQAEVVVRARRPTAHGRGDAPVQAYAVAVHDDRHRRHRRADADPRRRPADGFRTRDRDRFERLVDDAVASLPDELHGLLDGVVLAVAEVPPVGAVGGDDPVALASYLVPARGRSGPERLILFRRPLEARARTRAELAEVVREVVAHELADRHGLDDDDDELDDLGF
ncbi:hypothetical protein FTX61_11375 [Nitriliruptoraceae bacterium ZYF776]|nr:hypothetical protein [Profundirhabdus halotolerans]